ncbi:MAG: serine phosphatase RsbU (regulator of sigma subunit) [Crocinitomix sp.]|jgi:serine phosphatase RsbU (regulator of sigma subunit)
MRITLVLIVCLFQSLTSFGQYPNEIIITDENLGISLGENVAFFEDVKGSYEDISTVLTLKETAFETSGQSIPDFNFTANRFWLRFTLTNHTENGNFIFETGRTVTNKVEFFEVGADGVEQHYISGDDFAYDDKEIEHRKNLFPIALEKNESKTFYVKLESDGELLFAPIIVHDHMGFFAEDFKNQFKNGFYYGLIALVVIIYFFFFLFLRDRSFLFYILYAFSQGVLQFSLDGYSHHHLFPKGGYFTSHVLLVFAGLTILFLLTYVNHFLQLKKHSKSLWKIFSISRFAIGLIMLMSLIPGPLYELSFPIINGASLFGVLLAAYAIIRLKTKGVEVDMFFAIAFIILIIGGVVFILGNMSVVGDKIISLGALKISSALEFVVLSISMSNKYGKLQKEKEVAQLSALKSLKEKNAVMDESNVRLELQVKERTSEIELQKEELAKNNEEIVSSIKYAQRIQEAILPSDEHVNKLIPNAFIFYRPKDVVSGDFYFIESTNSTNVKSEDKYVLFAAVDCTGHGVPGAFMSIVGNNLLSQSLTEPAVNSPGEALLYLSKGVNKTLRRTIDGKMIRDGMDIAMCAFNHDRTQMFFAGAKNPLYLLRNKSVFDANELQPAMHVISESDDMVLLEIKGDKHPIGHSSDETKPYTNHVVNLLKGDQIYVFTDGYADQFGGPKGKKFNYRRYRELLMGIAEKPLTEQKLILENEFDKWLGDEEQIDDVLVMSVKID